MLQGEKEKIKILPVGNEHQRTGSECMKRSSKGLVLAIIYGALGFGTISAFAAEQSRSVTTTQPSIMRVAQNQTTEPAAILAPNHIEPSSQGQTGVPPLPTQGVGPQSLPAQAPSVVQAVPQQTLSPAAGTPSPQSVQPSQPSPQQFPGGRTQLQPIPPGPPGTMTGPPSAAESQGMAIQQAPQPAQTPGIRRPLAGAAGMVSLNFDDADIFSVIQTVFGDILKVNYVVDPKVQGRVTFRSVAPVGRDQVLPIMEVILRINAIGVVEDNGLYRIVPLSEVSREPSPISFGRDPDKISSQGKSLIQVVPIIYLQSTEVVKLITPFLSATAVVLDVPKSNQVIVVDTDASVRRVLQLIGTFDNETQKKKRAQVFVYPVQNLKARDISNLLNQIFFGVRAAMPGTVARPGTTATTTGQQSLPQTPLPSAQPLTQTGQQLRSASCRIPRVRYHQDIFR